MEWRHSGSPRPKIFRVKNPLEKFSYRFFGFKTASSSLIIFQRAKISTRSITHFCWYILKEKRPGKINKSVLFLHDNAPANRALATQKKMAYLGFQCLYHPPFVFFGSGPDDYHLFPGLKKTIESSPFFVRRGGHCCRDLVGRTTI